MERGVASRGARLVTARLGRPRDPARRALGPGCEELAVTDPDASPVREARPPGPKSPRWSAERRAALPEGRKGGAHKRLACPNTPNGGFARAPVRLSVLRPPPLSGARSKNKNRAPKTRRGDEMGCF